MCRPRGRPKSRPARRFVVAHGQYAKQGPFDRGDQARQCRVDSGRAGRRAPDFNVSARCAMPNAAENRPALSAENAPCGTAAAAAIARNRHGAEVGLARLLQHGRTAMAAHGLQGRTGSRHVAPVIDDQRPAAVTADARADGGGECACRSGDLGFSAGRRLGQEAREGRDAGRQGKAQRLAVGREADHAFAPAALRLVELAHRQGVEEFVGDHQRRARRHIVEALVPGRLPGGERRPLGGTQRFVDVDEMQADRAMKVRHAARGAQGVGHQGRGRARARSVSARRAVPSPASARPARRPKSRRTSGRFPARS